MTDDEVDTIDDTPSPVSDAILDTLLSRGRRRYCPDCYCSPCECGEHP